MVEQLSSLMSEFFDSASEFPFHSVILSFKDDCNTTAPQQPATR